MSTVFISYRRQTAPGEARALFNELVARLGKNAVFMDVDSIALGRDFRGVLQKTLESCDVMLVIIDKDWFSVKDEKGRIRLENPGDYVRQEVEAALKRDIVVTPVLVKGAQMPSPEELPAEIRDLVYRNAFELTVARWESDVNEMIRRLGLVPPEPAVKIETAPPPAPIRGAEKEEQAGGPGILSTIRSSSWGRALVLRLATRKGIILLLVPLVVVIGIFVSTGDFFQPKGCSHRSGYPVGRWDVEDIKSSTRRAEFSNFITFTSPQRGTWIPSEGQGSFTASNAPNPHAEIILTLKPDQQSTYVSTNKLVVSADGCRMEGTFADNQNHSGEVTYVFATDRNPSRK